MNLQSIEQEAMQLPAEERAALAARLLESLDELSTAETQRLWTEEALRRAEELDSGTAVRITGEQVRQDALALCR